MVPRFQKCKKFFFQIFNFFSNFSRFWNFRALFIVKQRFLKWTFLKKGWLGFAHIRSTCGPDLPLARHALRFDAYFCHRVTSEKSTVCVRTQWHSSTPSPWKVICQFCTLHGARVDNIRHLRVLGSKPISRRFVSKFQRLSPRSSLIVN